MLDGSHAVPNRSLEVMAAFNLNVRPVDPMNFMFTDWKGRDGSYF